MIVIVDYRAGNLTSVRRALDHLGVANCITADPEVVVEAERIIFPGVGHAGTAMSVLKERGLDVALREAFQKGAPLLGTCVGAQIALSRSEEGDAECLNLIRGDCARFRLADQSLKIPHMGWNTVELARDHPVLKDIEARTEFYFVHSYYMRPADRRCVYAWCDYEITFPAILGYRNLIATQFHSEKSGPAGLTLLRNFARWDGTEC